MSELKYLQFQPIDPASDADEDDSHKTPVQIDLNENDDEDQLEQFWEKVEEDIHQDPEWFTFADK
jgi:hypothetical protein